MPDLHGRVAIVTGGNIGLGFASTLALARQGAEVIIACRSVDRGQSAMDQIRRTLPDARLHVMALDLTDATSIARFGADFRDRYQQLDILMNNAGVVNLDRLQRDNAGHELHFSTNHLGHFALTGHLFPVLVATPGARVVTLSSLAHKSGTIDFDDLDWQSRPYSRVAAYGDSKLANLMFMLSLQEKFRDAGATALSVAAHPGLTGTERQQSIGIGGAISRFLATPVDKGVRSQLFAATEPDITGGDFIGPRFGLAGPPSNQNRQLKHISPESRAELWRVSEDLTGVRYEPSPLARFTAH